MKTWPTLLVLVPACASIPLPTTPPWPDAPPGAEVELCVVWGERNDRRRFEGVAELSFEPWHQANATVVVRHPSGLMVIDPAFGSAIAEDLSHVPGWFRIITGWADTKTPTPQGLAEAGIDPAEVRVALLTHAHWDHTGALRDLPNATVRLSKSELLFVAALDGYVSGGVMPPHFDGVWPRVRGFELDGPPVLRFDASKDLFGDGSMLAVPLYGHTPGSTGYLVRGPGGRRWLFIGDATWTSRGVEKPAHKTVPKTDRDRAKTGEVIGRLHVLAGEHPEIVIVPAHDADALATMPTCAAVTSASGDGAAAPAPR
ncbi:MAG: MBL fold metallo-hydrolase [Myxococcaceae bacterium]|nr:MBL fold metallo-hydrolase [Myxococcaceae bacterium]